MRKSGIILGISLVLIFLLFLFFNLTGNAVKLEQETGAYIFYKSLRVEINSDYSTSCFPKGEVMTLSPKSACCAGLKQISVIDEAKKGCSEVMGITLCSDCGNKLCEFGENKCNCPQDCR